MHLLYSCDCACALAFVGGYIPGGGRDSLFQELLPKQRVDEAALS